MHPLGSKRPGCRLLVRGFQNHVADTSNKYDSQLLRGSDAFSKEARLARDAWVEYLFISRQPHAPRRLKSLHDILCSRPVDRTDKAGSYAISVPLDVLGSKPTPGDSPLPNHRSLRPFCNCGTLAAACLTWAVATIEAPGQTAIQRDIRKDIQAGTPSAARARCRRRHT